MEHVYSVDKSTIIVGVPLHNQISKQFFHEILKENDLYIYILEEPRNLQRK